MLGMHIDSEVKDAIIQAQNATLQLQDHMSGILVNFEEQLAENAELKEKAGINSALGRDEGEVRNR
jgi:hypothetical protein